jgi:Protein of unknown function (DUF1320)
MSWIILTETDIATGITGPELNAVKTAALKSGQTDPVPDTISQVVLEVRGRVAACSQNKLGSGTTIPDELKASAIDIMVYRLCKRLPGAVVLTPQRDKANDTALALLRDVARCEFRIEQPASVTSQVIAGPAVQQVSGSARSATRDTMRGL